MTSTFRRIFLVFTLALFYSLIFFLYTAPLWSNFSAGFIGENTGNSDANQYVWNAYNFKRAILQGTNPFFTDLMLFPKGSWLFFHTYTPIIGAFHLLIPDNLTAVNVVLWLSFMLSGIGAYFFCSHFVKNRVFSLTAGLIFAFCPYKTAHLLEHYHLMLTATIPFFALSFIKGFRFSSFRFGFSVVSWKHAIGCFVLAFISFFSDYYAFFFLLYFSAGYAGYQIFLRNINWTNRKTWLYVGGVFVAGNVVLKILKALKVDDKGGAWWGGNVGSYFVPPAHLNWFPAELSEKFYGNPKFFNMPGSVENIVFPGFTILLITIIACFLIKRISLQEAVKPLVFLAIFFFIITLPDFKVLGKTLFKMPTALLHYIPLLNNIRCPTRIAVMLMLVLPVVCFYILNAWMETRWSKQFSIGVAFLILLIIGIELQPKAYAMILKKDVPAAYQTVAKMEGNVLFTIPFGLRDGMQTKGKIILNDLFYQTLHHKKMPGAYISRIDKAVFEEFDNDPVLNNLLRLQADSVATTLPVSQEAKNRFLNTYQPDIFLISPLKNQPEIETFIFELYSGRKLFRHQVNGYTIISVKDKVGELLP